MNYDEVISGIKTISYIYDCQEIRTNNKNEMLIYLDIIKDEINNNDEVKRFLIKIFSWEINFKNSRYSIDKFPLTPILLPHQENNIRELLRKVFSDNEIDLLVEISENNKLKNIILARINDLILLYDHKTTKKKDYAENAIKNYISYINASNHICKNELHRTINIFRILFSCPDIKKYGKDILSIIIKKISCDNYAFNANFIFLSTVLYEFIEIHKNKRIDIVKDNLLQKEYNKILSIIKKNVFDNFDISKYNFLEFCDIAIKFNPEDYFIITKKKLENILCFIKFMQDKKNYIGLKLYVELLDKEKEKLNSKGRLKDMNKELDLDKNFNPIELLKEMKFLSMDNENKSLDKKLFIQSDENVIIDLIKEIVLLIKNINHSEYFKFSSIINSIPKIIPNKNVNQCYDNFPKFFKYNDEELDTIIFYHRIIVNEIGLQIKHYLDCANKVIKFDKMEKYFFDIKDIFIDKYGCQYYEEKWLFFQDGIIQAIISKMHLTSCVVNEMEGFLRHILHSNGHKDDELLIMSNEKNYEYISITTILKESKFFNTLEKIYGYNLIFDLYLCLLCKKFTGYRHKVSHAEMTVKNYDHPSFYYTLGLCLTLIFNELDI